jgi:sugar/nucleoside kinase (ribokinase family)
MPHNALTVGVGAALMDLLLEENDAFLRDLGAEKGGMTLVDKDIIENALRRTSSKIRTVPGGSACNTLVGIGNLGGRARMIGRVGQDELADHFRSGLRAAGVEEHLRISGDADTGRVLSVVTPDAQRTMFTHLGASSRLHPGDVEDADFNDSILVHLEGYLLFNRPVVDRVLEMARKHRARVALDMGSFQVVQACRELLDELFERRLIDILMANEDEAKAYTGLGDAGSLEVFADKVDIAVVKIGKDGVLVAQGSERLDIEAHKARALDTTGAGDLWASGFLYGLNHGLTLESSANLGCKVGAEVVQVMGAVIPGEGWSRVHDYREGLRTRR